MCSEAQAWKIYFEIYGDVKNKITGVYEPPKSQEVLRAKLEELGFKEYSPKIELVNKFKKINQFDASSIIRNLAKKNFVEAEKILCNSIQTNMKQSKSVSQGFTPITKTDE